MKLFLQIVFLVAFSIAIFYAIFVVIPDLNIRMTKPMTTPKDLNLSSEKLTALVNKWRESQNLQSYIEDDRLCVIAKDRSDDPKLDNHEGFLKKYSNFPYMIQENLGYDNSEQKLLESWLASPSHAETLKKPYKYSCTRCDGNYCSQIFSNF